MGGFHGRISRCRRSRRAERRGESPNGRLAAMGAYRDGLRHGTWKAFDDAGIMRARAEFDHGRRCGTWEFRDERDHLRGSLRYVDGRLVSGTSTGAADGLVAHRTY